MKGLVSLVTGGASGLGKATVERLVQLGSKVVLCDLPKSKGFEIAGTLGQDKVVFVPVDVSQEDQVKDAVQITKQKFGKLNNVINCAGVCYVGLTYNFRRQQPLEFRLFKRMFDVNVTGTYNIITHCLELLGDNEPDSNKQKGVIVNTASVAAFDGPTGFVAYAGTKGAIASMTLPLARELSKQGIRVASVAPGFFHTGMSEGLEKKHHDFVMKSLPFPKRAGKPEEFAFLVQHIIENPMINGVTVRLDGAWKPTDWID